MFSLWRYCLGIGVLCYSVDELVGLLTMARCFGKLLRHYGGALSVLLVRSCLDVDALYSLELFLLLFHSGGEWDLFLFL